jgi:hypothetical protein
MNGYRIKAVFFTILSLFVLALFLVAAKNLWNAGNQFILSSGEGKTIEEGYLFSLGNAYKFGHAYMAGGMGVFASAVLVWVGWKK